ncbi:hypothetical protein VCHC51A1_2450 [Vibrio cholerae HC-51A1]|nr:hypothetical protein VCHC02A1_2523 [Vibrio cholerae HC-02A1]EKG49107.1 hypothetical protein VCHC50A1_2554 [Vibrio cholerae HC-50A1]EKG54852.1 hypothetical protein VCHC52A1_2557 [Vibrio cholerae HC-52A1]EKG59591.1 hypothetical protein VCHC56A1_2627 [Vibrio cholerae HC-56A1]EKG59884.1 hypothetical protein VCHC55A1_2554 [Vibrio cholerae HC-55A1]EKG68137.1 hypothetical protein VCHC57A1_2444 [Vibrio cholerae HC-57A1]EKG88779.1 hypothetical protein VCHC51A1_2450 [Vibrio cholerae HC-51A1]EKK9359
MQIVFILCLFIDLTLFEIKRDGLKFVTNSIGNVIKLHEW